MENRRIVFSTSTPNDQGGVIPNNSIDFSRYSKNPVILCEHAWGQPPIGLMSDIKEEGGKWTGVPVFHGIGEISQQYKAMYEGGFLKACSIGGMTEWVTNKAGQPVLDTSGNRTCAKFLLYEISMVSLPSNPDAVAEETKLAARIYEEAEINEVDHQIMTLSSKINMETPEELAAKVASKNPKAEETKLATAAPIPEELPTVIKDAIKEGQAKNGLTALVEGFNSFVKGVMGGMSDDKPASNIVSPTESEAKPTSTMPSTTTPVNLPQDPGKLKAEKGAKEKSEMDKTKQAAEEALSAAEKADEADKEGAMKIAEECMQKAKDAEAAYKAAMDADEDGEMSSKEKTTNSAKIIQMKTPEERLATLKLAAKPEIQARIGAMGTGVTFSQLSATDNKEGQRILARVQQKDQSQKNLEDYAILAASMMNDSKFKAVFEKTRFMQNVNEGQLKSYQSNPHTRSGLSVKDIAVKLASGYCSVMGRDNVMHEITTLNATDDFLASPDLFAMEFLSLAIFKLFPTTSWKNDIPIFGATETANNTGIIWANIAADPAIYRGAKPVDPANYTYEDTAVALNLTPYWLQPMLWTPLTMHQLRYDQMSTGWAQAFAKWGSVMDDDLIYILASTVPAGSIIYSSGALFNITYPNSPNQFYYNPTFSGTLNRPVLNDILSDEQIYLRQNFELQSEKPTMVLDPTAYTLLKQDPETKSLLTRWVTQDGAELLKFSNTILNERSRVAIFDPATEQVKDPRGAIPATATSANLGFIPSQVGIGLGMLDVFMIQDPSNYGYKMSADIRIGIVPLRKNYNGTSLLVYGPDRVS